MEIADPGDFGGRSVGDLDVDDVFGDVNVAVIRAGAGGSIGAGVATFEVNFGISKSVVAVSEIREWILFGAGVSSVGTGGFADDDFIVVRIDAEDDAGVATFDVATHGGTTGSAEDGIDFGCSAEVGKIVPCYEVLDDF